MAAKVVLHRIISLTVLIGEIFCLNISLI